MVPWSAVAVLAIVAIVVLLFAVNFPILRAHRGVRGHTSAPVELLDPLGVHWDVAAAACRLVGDAAASCLLLIALVEEAGWSRVVPIGGVALVAVVVRQAYRRLVARHEPFLLLDKEGLGWTTDHARLERTDLAGVVFFGSDRNKLAFVQRESTSARRLTSAALGHAVWRVVPLRSVRPVDRQLMLAHLTQNAVPIVRALPGAPRRLLGLALGRPSQEAPG